MTDNVLQKRALMTSFGRIAYLEGGNHGEPGRPVVLFVHGIPTSGYLWRHVIRNLEHDFACFAPDLMGLGDTEVDPATTRFDMDAQAEMLFEFMEGLGHRRFHLVCHDQGGAAAQIMATRLPARIESLVLTDCVAYDNWPVPTIARLQRLASIPWLNAAFAGTGLAEWLETSTPLSNFRRGVRDPERLSAETIAEYLRPLRGTRDQRERFRQFLLAGHPRYTELCADGLRQLEVPTAVIWAADDHYLSPSWGRKLAEEIPGTRRFELVPFCGHFWQEERPAEFTSIIAEFLGQCVREGVADRPAEEAA